MARLWVDVPSPLVSAAYVVCGRRQIRCEAEADGYSPDGRRFSRDTASAATAYASVERSLPWKAMASVIISWYLPHKPPRVSYYDGSSPLRIFSEPSCEL